jgi:hypothetical protein
MFFGQQWHGEGAGDSRGTQGGGMEVDDDCGWLTVTVLVHTTLDSSGMRWGQQAATTAARCSNKST